jgi:hypothetical protein
MMRRTKLLILTLLPIYCLSGCANSELMDEPQPVVIEKPLATVSDQHLEVLLDWVIIRGGPGSWATNSNWDEYRLRIRNLTPDTIRVNSVVVFDSLGSRIESSMEYHDLIERSQEAADRYKDADMIVKTGVGGDALIVAGGAVFVAGNAMGVAAATWSASVATGYAGLGLMVIAAPVLIVRGAAENREEDLVAREIVTRATPLPTLIGSGLQKRVTVFFPIAPSPRRIEVSYADSHGDQTFTLEAPALLNGLHIDE